MLELYHQIRPM